ncbi:uncharacterized protein LOC143289643 [Babylonia areolata]|uniref:uncharacterized protein LOC143289643 n=1 Tax=Babylonia areolata TaxID=304850 RepID=UPI003FCEF002
MTFKSTLQYMSTDMTPQSTLAVHGELQTDAQNESRPEGCVPFRFSEMEYLPWDNPDNIVSEEVELDARKARFFMMQILFLIGGPGNIMNMVVFFRQGLRDRVNLLLFSLSLADEIFLAMSMLLYGEEYYLQRKAEINPGPVLKFMVNHNLGGFLGSSFVSLVLSAIIACERCYCVLRPLKYQTLMRTRTMAVIIVVVYVVVLGLNFVAVFRYHFACVYDLDTGVAITMMSHSEIYSRYKDVVDNVDNVFFGAGLPVSMGAVVVIATVITTGRLRQAVAWRAETSSSLSPREVALTRMLIGTSVLLALCIFPSCLFRLACLFLPEVSTGRRQQNFYLMGLWITEIFLFINSSFNIFIYYVMGSRYRETFWALFRMNAGGNKAT